MDAIPRSLRVILGAVALAGAVALPAVLASPDPWAEVAGVIRSESHPGDLVVLTPAHRRHLVSAFSGLWVVAMDRRRLPRLRATRFSRLFVVTTGGLRATVPGFLEESLRRFGPVRVQIFGREGGGP